MVDKFKVKPTIKYFLFYDKDIAENGNIHIVYLKQEAIVLIW